MNKKLYTIIVFIVLASLDNSAIAILPAITRLVADRILINEVFIILIVTIMTFIISSTSFIWGYYGDKYSRKKLLLYGTIIWTTACYLSFYSAFLITPLNFLFLLITQAVAGIGLGSIASVGFSVIVDYVSPERRGLALSLWGLSQGVGTVLGYIIAILFAPMIGWSFPFLLISVITIGFLVLFIFIEEPKRGAKEKELQTVYSDGKVYDYQIKRADLAIIVKNRSNLWLILQGLFAQFVWGAIAILPSIFGHKLSLYGISVDDGQTIGGIIAGLFQIGGVFSIIFGWLGDKLQARTLKGRSIISSMGVFTGIPLFIAMLLIPYNFTSSSFTNPLAFIFGELATNRLFLIAFLCSLFAAIAMSADAPNFFALVGDINLPEHRGTFFGLTNFINGLGRGLGLLIVSGFHILLFSVFGVSEAYSWVYAMVMMQLFFIPAGVFYVLTIRTAPKNILNMRAILKFRSESLIT